MHSILSTNTLRTNDLIVMQMVTGVWMIAKKQAIAIIFQISGAHLIVRLLIQHSLQFLVKIFFLILNNKINSVPPLSVHPNLSINYTFNECRNIFVSVGYFPTKLK